MGVVVFGGCDPFVAERVAAAGNAVGVAFGRTVVLVWGRGSIVGAP